MWWRRRRRGCAAVRLPARRLAIAEHLRRTAVPDAPTILSKKVFNAVEQLTEGLDRGFYGTRHEKNLVEKIGQWCREGARCGASLFDSQRLQQIHIHS